MTILNITNDQIINGELSPEVSLEGITEIRFTNLENLKSISSLPTSITAIECFNCSKLHKISNLSTQHLKFSKCNALTDVTNITAENLTFTTCEALEEIENITATNKLEFHHCHKLKKTSNLTAHHLKFYQCNALTDFTNITAENLSFTVCEALEEIEGMTATNKLEFNQCTNLKKTSNLSAQHLQFFFCKALADVTNITAENLTFSACAALEKIENIPTSTKILEFDRCPKLIPTPALLANLEELERHHCRITYPDHFNLHNQVTIAKTRLQEIIQQYKETNPDAAEPEYIQKLLHRFLTEGLNQRGGMSEIAHTVHPTLDILEKNPSHLKISEKIASLLVYGCVNQPVTFWSEISAVASIADAPSMSEKMEAAKHLIILDQIKACVSETFKNSSAVEVEASNKLLREIYQKIRVNEAIQKPWLSVPGPVAYEEFVENWPTPESIDKFYQTITPILEQTPLQTAEMICNGVHCKALGEIAFPKQLALLDKDFQEQKEILSGQFETALQNTTGRKELETLEEAFNKHSMNIDIAQSHATTNLVTKLTIDSIQIETTKNAAKNVSANFVSQLIETVIANRSEETTTSGFTAKLQNETSSNSQER